MPHPHYEAIGRYTVLSREVRNLVQQRNGLLVRAAAVLKNATELTPESGARVARRCNFPAVRSLLDEAAGVDAALLAALDELNTLAPLADMPELSLL